MNPFIGKTSIPNNINIDGIIFKGEGTRLVSNLSVNLYHSGSEISYNLRIHYDIKEAAYFKTLFSIAWYGNSNLGNDRQDCRIHLITNSTSLTPANEKKILKMKKSNFNGTYFKKPGYDLLVPSPIVFCQIPFLEDPVKNWILNNGIQRLTPADIKKLLRGIKIN
jgi:hypothetical protein